ncbi:CRC domain-containing protein TSO1 [Spatholobus suberectus]|nr:CRC domain-containing protein TSO1 [Spatholobus suberectus]
MDSPKPSKNYGSSSAFTRNANTNANDSSESPEVQESPFFRYVSTLSPITTRTSHVAQGFLGLNSPPLVFKSPRISQRETQLMERPQRTQSLSGQISQSEIAGNSLGEAPGDSRKSNSQQPLSERFITDTQKVFDSKNDANTQNYSSPPSIDEYLADPGDIDQMYSADQDVEQSTDAAETSLSGPTHSKKNILKFDRKDGPGDKPEESLPSLEDSKKSHQEKPAYGAEPEKMEGEKNDIEWASQEPTKLESNLAADVFEKQYSHDPLPELQLVENYQWDHKNCTPQWMPDPLQDVKGCEDYNEMVSTSHVTAENILQDGSEATLKYHGIRRRCLQFEEAASNALGSNKSRVKLNASSNKMKMVKLSEPVTSLCPQQGSGNFPLTGPKPSGIGLHLNSIINAMPTGQAATTGVRLSDGLQGMKSASSIRLQRMENVKRSILSSNADGQSLVDARNEGHEIDASVATDAGNPEDFNQPPSPCKKKKKTSVTADGNGGKRCNCKRSKCLKLYCECFTHGTYCTDLCACQGCLNRPEYAETVSETKQQIESRNPHAFTPKILQSTTDNSSNNMEDKNLTTPSSARHKRGCNCKRSMCLKKYCECYQANVGCSSGCRCEGCKNVYGKKEDYVALEQHTLSKERVSNIAEKGSDSTFHNKLEMVASKTNYDLHRLSPITPSLQCSDQGKEAAKSRVISGNYLPSPESVVNTFASCVNYTKSSENSHSSHALPEANEMLGTAPYDSQNNCDNVNMMDQLSPTSQSVAILLQLTPLSNPEPLSGASSFSSGANDWTNISQSRLSHGCIHQLPSGSLRWRSSPLTPSTGVGEAQYLQCPESDSRLFDILENETPDILKEASTPMKSVKVNSPTQKRVSPPQSHHHGIGSSSSGGGLRSGRKFILKAVPSFPPLSPCVDSKGNGNEDLGNSESK